MTARPSLEQLRQEAVEHLNYFHHSHLRGEWFCATELQKWLGLPGPEWYRISLVLERLANDGFAEIEIRGNRRRFRRRQEPTS